MSLPIATPVPAPGLANTPFRSLSTGRCHGGAPGAAKDRHSCVQLLTVTELTQVEFTVFAGNYEPAPAMPIVMSFWPPKWKLNSGSRCLQQAVRPCRSLQQACGVILWKGCVLAKCGGGDAQGNLSNALLLKRFSLMHRLPQEVCLMQGAGWQAVAAAFRRLS